MKEDYFIKEVEKLLAITGDKTRLKIMFSLLDDSKCTCHSCQMNCGQCQSLSCMTYKSVSEIVDCVGSSQSLVSHQLRILKDAHLVKTRREGTKIYYCLNDGHVQQLIKTALEHVKEGKEND
ncbi:MAG: metalloregulator ArsR/SmtB family transcription factor [Bacilli bacterium]